MAKPECTCDIIRKGIKPEEHNDSCPYVAERREIEEDRIIILWGTFSKSLLCTGAWYNMAWEELTEETQDEFIRIFG